MRWIWLLLVLGCGKKDDVEGDLAKLVPQVQARFSAVLAKIDAEAPPCTAIPHDGPMIMLMPSLVRLAGGPRLPDGDPNGVFTPTNYESQLIFSYTNQFNPKRSTREYASKLLAQQQAVVVKIDKFDRYQLTGAESYQPGTLHVRAILFDLATGKPTCAKKYDVTNSNTVFASKGQFAMNASKESVEAALQKDLESQFDLSGPSVKRY